MNLKCDYCEEDATMITWSWKGLTYKCCNYKRPILYPYCDFHFRSDLATSIHKPDYIIIPRKE